MATDFSYYSNRMLTSALASCERRIEAKQASITYKHDYDGVTLSDNELGALIIVDLDLRDEIISELYNRSKGIN